MKGFRHPLLSEALHHLTCDQQAILILFHPTGVVCDALSLPGSTKLCLQLALKQLYMIPIWPCPTHLYDITAKGLL
jgi:hypothetical protein